MSTGGAYRPPRETSPHPSKTLFKINFKNYHNYFFFFLQTHLRLRRQTVAHLGGQPVPRVLRARGDPAGHRHRVLCEQGGPGRFGLQSAPAARCEGNLSGRLHGRKEEEEGKIRVIFAVRNLFVFSFKYVDTQNLRASRK